MDYQYVAQNTKIFKGIRKLYLHVPEDVHELVSSTMSKHFLKRAQMITHS